MSLAYLTRRATFAAAHRYWRPAWFEERNRQAFGACANPHGHGQSYAASGLIPSTENLLARAWPRVAGRLPDGVRLRRSRLREDEILVLDCYGGAQEAGVQ